MTKLASVPKSATAILLLGASVFFLPSNAIAQEAPVIVQGDPLDVRSERISFAKLDLAKAGHQKALKLRVAGAIQRVCLYELGRDGLQNPGYYVCEKGAWDGASQQIDNAIASAQGLALLGLPSVNAIAILVSAK